LSGSLYPWQAKWAQVLAGNAPRTASRVASAPARTVASGTSAVFEELPTTPTDFGNDGDFNDQVFLVTGVTCDGGEPACRPPRVDRLSRSRPFLVLLGSM